MEKKHDMRDPMSKSWPIARMRYWMSNVLNVKPFPLTITLL